ncbi:MAG: hypothetical protein U0231_20195 [Nitrospiraceae bacterium]
MPPPTSKRRYAYYKEVLGFESSWTRGEPPSFGSVSVEGDDHVQLQPELCQADQQAPALIKVDEVDDLYRLHTDRSAKIVSEIEDKPWGVGVRRRGLERLHLRFAGPPSSSQAASRPFPEGVGDQAQTDKR